MQIVRALFVAAVLVVSQFSFAASKDSLEDLETLLKGYSSFQADFSQSTIDAQAAVLQSLKGIIKLQKPGNLYWQTEDPFPQVLISNGQTIWQYDEDLEQVVVQDYKKQLENLSFLQLLEKPSLIKEHFVVANESVEGKQRTFDLTATDPASAIKSVSFVFAGKVLKAATFKDSLNQLTNMTFSNVKLNQAVDKKWFTFAIPEDADVIYQ